MKSGMLIASMFALALAGAAGLAMARPIVGPATLAAARPSSPIESAPADLRSVLLKSLANDHSVQARDPFNPDTIWVPQTFTPQDGNASFGWSVAIDSAGTTAMIAAPANFGGLFQQGFVYVFTKTGGVWTQSQILGASDGAAGDHFGQAIAISGSTAVISSVPWDTGGFPLGGDAAYIFTSSGGTWSEQQKLTASDGVAGDWFGMSAAIDGSNVVVGAYGVTVGSNTYQGAAYVFSLQSGTWVQTQKLTNAEGVTDDLFGSAVAVHGDTVVAGTYETSAGHFQGGAAYVFVDSGGTWEQVQRLSNESEVSNRASFGSALALNDDTLLAGAYAQSVNAVLTGAVYVFTRTDGLWSQTQVLSPADGVFLGLYGISVALDDQRIIVGADNQSSPPAPGASYIYALDDGTWNLEQELAPNAGADFADHFGVSVAIAGGTAVVGSDFVGTGYFYTRQLEPPVASVAPGSLVFDVPSGGTASTPLTIANGGEADLTWAIAETLARSQQDNGTPTPVGIHGTASGPLNRGFAASPSSGATDVREQAPWAPRAPDGTLSFILDDGSYNDAVSLNDGVVEFAGIYLNRFTPPDGTGAFIVDSITIGWPTNANGTLVGKEVNLLAYYDADGDADPTNAVRLGGDNLITIETLDTFTTYTVNLSVPGPGDIYIGFESTYAIGGSTPILFPAALDTTSSQGRSWAIASTTGPGPDPDDLSNNELVGTIDSFGFPGNWMIRATGTGGSGCSDPSDVSWLSETPANGTVAGGSSQDVTVTADASGLDAGTYSAVLCVTTNDNLNNLIQVPVSLTVAGDNNDAVFQNGFDGAP